MAAVDERGVQEEIVGHDEGPEQRHGLQVKKQQRNPPVIIHTVPVQRADTAAVTEAEEP